MLPHAVLAVALLSAVSPVLGDETCTVQVGPAERFVQGRDAVVQPGEKLTNVTALRGRVIVRGGAEVEDAMALGGDLVLEAGARRWPLRPARPSTDSGHAEARRPRALT